MKNILIKMLLQKDPCRAIILIGLILLSCIGEVRADVNYFLYNAPGRGVVQLVNSSNTLKNVYTYDSFGNIKTSTENVNNVYKYDAERLESESNLIYLRNRYYDSFTGRFISKDFIRGSVQDPRTINPYPYCANNPVKYTDSQGLWFGWDDAAFAGAGFVSGAVGQVAGDLLSGKGFNALRTLGAGIGGAIGGEALLYTGNPVLSGAAGSAASSGLQQLFAYAADPNHSLDNFNFSSALTNTLVGGISAGIGAKLLTSPLAGSYEEAVSNQMISFATTSEEFTTSEAASAFTYNLVGSISDVANQGLFGAAQSLGNTAYDAAATSFGGVDLNATATLLGNVQDFGGATYDQATGQVILYGQQNVTLPPMDLDDLSVAVDSEYGLKGAAADPGVSIGTQTSTVPGQMYVGYFGAVMDTGFGETLFNSDRLLKSLVLGQDNITGQPVSVTVPLYVDMINRYKAGGSAGLAAAQNNPIDRMWFTPKLITLAQSADGSSMEFSTATMQLLTSSKLNGISETDTYAENFATEVTNDYDLYANEFPVLQQLTRLGKITAVVKWIQSNNIPFDLSFFSNYVPQAVPTDCPSSNGQISEPSGCTSSQICTSYACTPQYTPQTSISGIWSNGSGISITGGVIYTLNTSNFATTTDTTTTAPSTAAGQAAINARPSETNFSWNFSAQDHDGLPLPVEVGFVQRNTLIGV